MVLDRPVINQLIPRNVSLDSTSMTTTSAVTTSFSMSLFSAVTSIAVLSVPPLPTTSATTTTATTTVTSPCVDAEANDGGALWSGGMQGDLSLVMVGRRDGTVDLFALGYPHPLYSWNLCEVAETFMPEMKKKGSVSSPSSCQRILREVVMIKSPSTSAASFVFFVVDSLGYVYCFDLSERWDLPISMDRILEDGCGSIVSPGLSAYFTSLSSMTACPAWGASVVDLSILRPGSRQAWIATMEGSTASSSSMACQHVKFRRLDEELFPREGMKDWENLRIQKFHRLLHQLMGQLTLSNIALTFDASNQVSKDLEESKYGKK